MASWHRIEPLELRSSLTLDDARIRLSELGSKGSFPLANTWTEVHLEERGTHVEIQVVRQRGRNVKALIEGELRADLGGGTVFSGQAAVDPLTWYLPLAIGALAIPYQLWTMTQRMLESGSLSLLPVTVGIAVFAAMGIGYLELFVIRNRRDLAADFQKALASP